MGVIYKIKTEEYKHGFMNGDTVVYSDLINEYDAFMNCKSTLESGVANATGNEVKGERYYIPTPIAHEISFTASDYYITLKEGESKEVTFTAIAKDKFGVICGVEYEAVATIDTLGEHVFEAKSGDLIEKVTILAMEHNVENEVNDEQDLMKRVRLLEDALFTILE